MGAKLRPDASEALLLAARAHHIRRWAVPRSTYPEGREGYLRWRSELHRHHAGTVAAILEGEGYDGETIARVQDIVHKRQLARDPEVQTLEDALCLVFLETQFHDLAARLDSAKMVEVMRKTFLKMSPAGQRAALELPLDPVCSQNSSAPLTGRWRGPSRCDGSSAACRRLRLSAELDPEQERPAFG